MIDREKTIDGINKILSETDEYDGVLLDAISLLKEQKAVEPILEQDSMVCGVCGHDIIWQKMIGDGVWVDEHHIADGR